VSKFTVTIVYDGAKFRVEGSATPYVPARVNCSNDDACPAEGGVEEVTSAHLLDVKGETVTLPDFMQEHLDEVFAESDDVAERVAEALSEIEGDYE
jgi:hypothetical protein